MKAKYCRKEHLSALNTRGVCSECRLAWRLANAENIRAQKRAWRLANIEKVKAKDRAHKRAAYKKNPARVLAANRAWSQANPEVARAMQRRRKGIPCPTRPAPRACEICGRPPHGRFTSLAADHNHRTKTFRGWLCNNCNLALGNFSDDIARLRKAILYLARTTHD